MKNIEELEKVEITDSDNITKTYSILTCYHSDVTDKSYVICIDPEETEGMCIYPFTLSYENDNVVYNIVEDDEDKKEILRLFENVMLGNGEMLKKDGE